MYERLDDVAKKRGSAEYKSTTALGKFLQAEIEKRHISATKFADECGVSTSTVTDSINGKTDSPSLPFLRKLATYTKFPLTALIALSYPDVADEISDVSADDLMLALRLHALDPMLRKAVISILNSE